MTSQRPHKRRSKYGLVFSAGRGRDKTFGTMRRNRRPQKIRGPSLQFFRRRNTFERPLSVMRMASYLVAPQFAPVAETLHQTYKNREIISELGICLDKGDLEGAKDVLRNRGPTVAKNIAIEQIVSYSADQLFEKDQTDQRTYYENFLGTALRGFS